MGKMMHPLVLWIILLPYQLPTPLKKWQLPTVKTSDLKDDLKSLWRTTSAMLKKGVLLILSMRNPDVRLSVLLPSWKLTNMSLLKVVVKNDVPVPKVGYVRIFCYFLSEKISLTSFPVAHWGPFQDYVANTIACAIDKVRCGSLFPSQAFIHGIFPWRGARFPRCFRTN